MRTTTRATATIALALASALGLSGCGLLGKEAPKAADAWNKSQDAMGKYKSMNIHAEGVDNSKPIALDLDGTVDGKQAKAKVKQGAEVAEYILTNDKTYMKANDKMLASQFGTSSVTSKMADKWVEVPKSASSANTNDVLKDLVKGYQDDSSDFSKKMSSAKATVTEDKVNGQDAWKIVSEDKKATVWLAQNETYDLLKAEGEKVGGSNTSKMNKLELRDHDKPVNAQAPAGAKDLAELAFGK